ncbi:MAG: tRNA (adenosine(37)-N6)-dimethylallyltransferase MiaA [Gemmatimonadaceae bacterium]
MRVICGPTAAGKSALALHLGERFDATIVSADSRQIYIGFDVGTAKPALADRARVPHRGIDVAPPTQRYSAATWADAAATWIAHTQTTGREALVAGGTGFYIAALVTPLFASPHVDRDRRAALERFLSRLTAPDLRRWCSTLDPARAGLGPAQLRRAVETALLTGRRMSDLLRDSGRRPARAARYLYVDPGPALAARIERRTREMIDGGWPEEVSTLRRHVPDDAPAWKAAGYGAVRAWVEGTLTRATARERVIVETRQYAKRQRTWFRHQLPPDRVTPLDPTSADASRAAERWWRDESTA